MNNRAIWISFFLIMAVLAPSLSQAQTWHFLSADDNDVIDIDTASIKRFDNQPGRVAYQTRWNLGALNDSSTESENRSSISKTEIDCRAGKTRIKETQFFSQRYGQGSITESDLSGGSWEAISPNSWEGTLKGFICDAIDLPSSPKSYDPNFKIKTLPKVSPDFTNAYQRALKRAGNQASSVKAGQQEWWKERENTCGSVPIKSYESCMQEEESKRIQVLNNINPAVVNSVYGRTLSIPIKLHQPYLQARKALLKAGWKIVPQHQSSDGTTTCEEDTYEGNPACGVYKEITDCSGSGVGYCGMVFGSSTGLMLGIGTTGGAPPDAIIDSWSTFNPSAE